MASIEDLPSGWRNDRAMQAQTQDLRIALGERSYPIRIGSGLLDNPGTYANLPSGRHALVVTNATVAPLYGARLVQQLAAQFAKVHLIALPDGEAHKDWISLQSILDTLLRERCDRKTVLFALGGGVIGDLTGFAAACYMRGVPYVQVPTTLLAQVDSSVGGKTGINHPLGKNMIGAFHQPSLVVADTDLLNSLPQRELVAGLAEVIKYGPIADDAFFAWIEASLPALLARDEGALKHAIRTSCAIKAAVVAADERESDVRAILNFGHTFGHAIETGLGHGEWLHGEAVGCGMVMAIELSHKLGLVSRAYADRVTAVIRRAGLPTTGPALGVERYFELMQGDKKAEGGDIRFVLIQAPGTAIVRTAPRQSVVDVLEAFCA